MKLNSLKYITASLILVTHCGYASIVQQKNVQTIVQDMELQNALDATDQFFALLVSPYARSHAPTTLAWVVKAYKEIGNATVLSFGNYNKNKNSSSLAVRYKKSMRENDFISVYWNENGLQKNQKQNGISIESQKKNILAIIDAFFSAKKPLVKTILLNKSLATLKLSQKEIAAYSLWIEPRKDFKIYAKTAVIRLK
jgi:hypothetical protein